MKKFHYSMLFKLLAFTFQQICIIVFVLSAVMLIFLYDKKIINLTDIQAKPFTESEYYEQSFKQSVNDVLKFISYREKFETNGIYDPKKPIDILEFMDHEDAADLLKESNYRPVYYVEDLYRWSKYGYELLNSKIEFGFYVTDDNNLIQWKRIIVDGTIVMDEEAKIDSMAELLVPLQNEITDQIEHSYGGNYDELVGTQKDMGNSELITAAEVKTADSKMLLEEAIQKVINGRLYELHGNVISVLLRDLGFLQYSNSTRDQFVQEDYLSVSLGSSIMEAFLSDKISFEEMQQLYDALEFCLSTIGNEVSFYKKQLNIFDKNDSNLIYAIKEGAGRTLYTNIKNDDIINMPLIELGESRGSYFYYNEPETRLVTNVGGLEDEFYNVYENIYRGINRIIFVSIDNTFPIEDEFYEERLEYDSLYPWVRISFVILIISLLICFLCLIYLTISAGVVEQSKNIALCWFDRIKTELLLAGIVFVCAVIVLAAKEVSLQFRNNEEIVGLLATSGFLAFIGDYALIICYLSLVRRAKASTLWKNSIFYYMMLNSLRFLKNRKAATRTILLTIFQIMLLVGMFLVKLPYVAYIAPAFVVVVEFLIFAREGVQRGKLMDGIKKISGGDLEYKIDTMQLKGDIRVMGDAVNTIGEGLYRAVDDSMKNERLKAELITNVSHDIKTPLTSIINYVDLIKREEIQDSRIQSYIKVLDNKSQRLKQLAEDLVEASKAASGNVTLNMDRINFVELIYQIAGESAEKFEEKNLTAIMKVPQEAVVIIADGRQIWRVIENIYNNAAKYALENTRIYLDMELVDHNVVFSMKNISAQPLNINADELTERFIRGDVSRSTEGSGLGLSIAKSLTELMNGVFEIYLDGDLFKVTISFPLATEKID